MYIDFSEIEKLTLQKLKVNNIPIDANDPYSLLAKRIEEVSIKAAVTAIQIYHEKLHQDND